MSTFVSYAQNFEDVILYRALRDVREGFYVDVGAQHPLRDSVTRAFYERGWRGINIEPVPAWHGLLEVDRPEDTNLRLVAGAAEGEVGFFEVQESGLSTTDAQVAAKHALDGFKVSMLAVRMATLDAILSSHGDKPIHFLKIDVEGGEANVLRGLSLDRLRPWIIVVEATLPNTQVDTAADWEHMITGAGYSMVYHDGLNRFYLSDEHGDLRSRFGHPPNFFDNFVRHADWERGEQARHLGEEVQVHKARIAELEGELEESAAIREELQAELTDAEVQIGDMTSELNAAAARLTEVTAEKLDRDRRIESMVSDRSVQREWTARTEALERRIAALLQSRSWRLTAPLRRVSEMLGAAREFPELDAAATIAPVSVVRSDSARQPAVVHWNPAMPQVPDERRLLELANSGTRPDVRPPPLQQPAEASSFQVDRIDSIIRELRSLSYPPKSLPPTIDRLPGSGVLKSPVLRLYERLFRKQSLINDRVAEALRLLRDNQRNS